MHTLFNVTVTELKIKYTQKSNYCHKGIIIYIKYDI